MGSEPLKSETLSRRTPPGQRYVDHFPLYDITPVRPRFDPATYAFRVEGAVENPYTLTWAELQALPAVEVEADFHCVTGWSKKALRWTGVPTTALLERADPRQDVVQVMAHCLEGYTTNVPLEFLRLADSLVAYEMNGAPLTPEHGAPLRLLVPQLYAWKSAKYLTGLECQTEWRGGFWEERGYHLIGDPWEVQRYSEPLEKVREYWRKIRVTKVERAPKESSD